MGSKERYYLSIHPVKLFKEKYFSLPQTKSVIFTYRCQLQISVFETFVSRDKDLFNTVLNVHISILIKPFV